ncbi:hypothetical protein Nepgr_015790 [Nepenthes gracilis]|uniref:Uncharacterized protein n=1 Tax=Nepenthes gracilis TaxID=150966 RepID=A0AAD3XRF3_NEPGR|nr:hypothetical protein Nepgr_015790 [Nepenthes gracilis]
MQATPPDIEDFVEFGSMGRFKRLEQTFNDPTHGCWKAKKAAFRCHPRSGTHTVEESDRDRRYTTRFTCLLSRRPRDPATVRWHHGVSMKSMLTTPIRLSQDKNGIHHQRQSTGQASCRLGASSLQTAAPNPMKAAYGLGVEAMRVHRDQPQHQFTQLLVIHTSDHKSLKAY